MGNNFAKLQKTSQFFSVFILLIYEIYSKLMDSILTVDDTGQCLFYLVG